MIEESFINTIDSQEDELDANSIGEDSTGTKVEGANTPSLYSKVKN